MNEKFLHSTIIVLLVAGLLLTGASVYVLKEQVQQVAMSVKSIEQGMMDMKQAPSPQTVTPSTVPTQALTQTSHYDNSLIGVIFDYPKGWFVEEYAFEDDGGKNSLRLTSSNGLLESAVSSGGPICSTQTCFEQGMQMDIVPMDPILSSQFTKGELTRLRTVYTGVDSIIGCDGAGCPSRWYVYSCPNGSNEIRITFTDSSYEPIVGEILKSFSAYCQ